jgi:hypothetical protein
MSNSVITATMQLSNTGGLDKYLTMNPETSLFTYSYKQTTPFAKNTVMIPFNERVDFGRTITATVPFLGDVLNTVHLYFRLPQLTPTEDSTYLGWTNTIGYAMIESVQVRIGETIFDSHNGLCMEIMDELTVPETKKPARNKSIGRYDTVNVLPINALGIQDIYIPLQFWFNKKLACGLPLSSLSGQLVKFYIKLRSFDKIVTYDGSIIPEPYSILDSGMILDYYILSDDEKTALYKDPMDPPTYLIEQWQYESYDIHAGTTTNRFRLDFTNAIKEIIFVVVEIDSEENNDFFNFGRRDNSMLGGELLSKIGLTFDGKERFAKLPESFYRMLTVQRYHSYGGMRNIYCIPFSEFPEINQPTGTVNFSRYDNIDLALDFIDSVPACRLHILGINYNRVIIQPNESIQIEFLT